MKAKAAGLDEAVAAAHEHRRAQAASILSEFAGLLRLPNVSRDLPAVRANAAAIAALLGERGVAAETLELPGAAPVVAGRIDVPGATRTIGIYAHYDGQPVEPEEWTFGPWEPTLCTAPVPAGGAPVAFPGRGDAVDPDWRLYARSAADDKAPIIALAAACDALAAAGLAPRHNVTLLFEGEEEIGSGHLADYLSAHRERFAADLWLICDGPVHPSGQPQIVFGVRGITEIEITVYGAARPLHSGHYGNWAPNPALELARLLATMKGGDGRVLVEGFYDDTVPITPGERAAIDALPDWDGPLRRELGLAATEAGSASHAERMMLPSLNVRGLAAGGVGSQAANVVPAAATASIDIRLAAGDDPVAMLDRVEAHVACQGYHVVREEPSAAERERHPRLARLDRMPGYPAVRTPVDLPAVAPVLAAAQAAAGRAPIVMPTLGGSVPLHSFASVLGAPLVVAPFANHDNNQHAADENLRIGNLWYGVDLMAALLAMS